MVEAVIVSTARTPIGKAVRGAFNITHGADLGGHVIRHAVERAGIEPGEVEDVVMGCAKPEGATGGNIARQAALRAGLPVTAAGADRQPLLLIRPAGDRHRRAQHPPATACRSPWPAGWSRSASCRTTINRSHYRQ